MDIVMLSGAHKGATRGGQRYEQLVLSLRRLTRYVVFACPFSYPPDEIPEVCDVVVVGFPFNPEAVQIPSSRLVIYDICDDWGASGWHADLSSFHQYWLSRADAIVYSHPSLFSKYPVINKPSKIIPNGLRTDINWKALRESVKGGEKVNLVFWGSHYVGQSWWALDELVGCAIQFPQFDFHFFLATDRKIPVNFIPRHLPSNVHIYCNRLGFYPYEIVSYIKRPCVGLIPYKETPIAYCADPIKSYEYCALGWKVLAVNCYPVITPMFHNIISLFGNPIRILLDFLCKLNRESNLDIDVPTNLIPTWDDRAIDYLSFIEVVLSTTVG